MLFGVDFPVPNAKEIHAIGSNKKRGRRDGEIRPLHCLFISETSCREDVTVQTKVDVLNSDGENSATTIIVLGDVSLAADP
jgi:hypothetical protein